MFEKGIPPGSASDYREVINDKNDILINFFRVLQEPEQNKALCARLEYTLYSRSEHKRALELCKNPTNDAVLMAWAWFVNISLSFASKQSGGYGYGVVFSHHAVSIATARARICEYASRLNNAYIECQSAIEVIQRWDCPQALHYIDPPYPGTDQGHYGGFTQADFEALIFTLEACSGAVVLSCYNNPAVPAHWEKHEFAATASSKGVTGANRDHAKASTARASAGRTECVWIKPASGEVRPELKAAMERHAGHRKQINWLDSLETEPKEESEDSADVA